MEATAVKEKRSLKKVTDYKKLTVLVLIFLIIFNTALYFEYIIEILPVSSLLDTSYKTSSNEAKLSVFKNYIISADRDGVTAVNKSGEVKWRVPEILDVPVVAASKKETVAAAAGGTDIYRISGNGSYEKLTADYEIINLKASDSKTLLAILDRPMYNGGVAVYAKDSSQVMSWWAGENRLMDADISANGKNLAVSCLKTDGNSISTEIICFGIADGGKELAKLEIEDEMVNAVKWVENNRLLAVCEDSVYVFSEKGDEKWKYILPSGVINCFNLENSSNLVFVCGSSAYDKKSRVLSFKSNGKINGDFEVNNTVTKISANRNSILMISENGIHLANKSGRRLRTKEGLTLPSDARLFKNGNRVYADFGNEAKLFYCNDKEE